MPFKVIYKPKGRAREYANLALNIYDGCSFGCTYCYAPRVLKKDRELYHKAIKARENLLEKVVHDCQQNIFKGHSVLLCFTCDPYQHIDNELQTTREVLKLFKQYNINFSILTKAGRAAERDFDLYKPGDSFGSTLTFRTGWESVKWEPHAALPVSRFEAIKDAHAAGIKTWVSLEPVIEPATALDIVHLLHDYVDFWKVGKWNYDERANQINWKQFGENIEMVFQMYGCKYYIKEDLRKEMGK